MTLENCFISHLHVCEIGHLEPMEKQMLLCKKNCFFAQRVLHYSLNILDFTFVIFDHNHRDYLFRLSLDGLALLEESRWPAADEVVRLCQDKGQSEDDCHNYIRVLHVHGMYTLCTHISMTQTFAIDCLEKTPNFCREILSRLRQVCSLHFASCQVSCQTWFPLLGSPQPTEYKGFDPMPY
jgi:hypothetical protein